MEVKQMCGNCAWYEKPWSGPSHGFCSWLEHHELVLPPWLENAARAMAPNAGGTCGRFESKIIHQDNLPDIHEFEFSVRLCNVLRKYSIDSTRKLINTTAREFLGFKGSGITSFRELERKLKAHGLKLKEITRIARK